MPEAESSPAPLLLASGFPAASRSDWTALVDRSGGVDRLVRTTPDGIAVPPLYTAPDAPAPSAREWRAVRSGGWDVRQRHAEPDPATARTAIVADLENGVGSIWLAVGTGATAVADLAQVLADVHLDLAPIVLDAGGHPAGDTTALAAAETFLGLDRVAPADLLGTLGLDPIGARARAGTADPVESVVPLALRVAAEYPRVRAVVVDAVAVHETGGSDAQELGFALASGVAYLRVLTAAGLGVADAARLLEFRFAATAQQFPTIAKLRAARRLWSRVTRTCGEHVRQFQHAIGSPTMLTRRDPYLNLLRGTLAGFSAGVGGADAVTVAPFDAALGADEPFARRLARNTQALLIEESHVAQVIDPAGGSWYVESFTDALARAGWAFFQQLEAAGGAVAALDDGVVARAVAQVRAGRERDVATRRAPLTGVSEFPDLAERPVVRRPRPARPGGGLPVYRPAAPYEELRDRSDAHLAATGARPRAFLATLGPLAGYAARAGFARNLLHAGGVEVLDAGPTGTAADVVAAFAAAHTPVAVLCATDALYAERGSATIAALRAAGATHVLLAGAADVPGDPEIDGRLIDGGDALAALVGVHTVLEVAP